jgi:glycosyltransferase involved in cell wall biosynthesis
MQRRSVLLVSYHYLPAATPGSRRLDTMARMLAARGWESIILTATGAHNGDAPTPGIEVIRTTRRPLGARDRRAAIDSPMISRIPIIRHAARFPDKYAPWAMTLAPRIASLVRSRGIDVVLSSSPPHSTHMAVAAARAMAPFRWVAEFRDPWMFPSRRLLNPASAALQRRMERRVLRLADRVVTNTPGNRDALLGANPGVDPNRVRVSTNGYDATLFAPGSFPAAPGEAADITYVGELYPGMVERYCAAVATIRARNPEHVPRLAVYGTINSSERKVIAAHGLQEFVEDRGFVSHEESIAAMKNARALLVLLPPHERWRTCVPSKLYWYLAARRPIIAMVPEGDAATLVREMNAGHVLAGDSPEALGRELEVIVVGGRRASGALVTGSGTERYAMEAIVGEMDRMLREVVDGSRA